MRLGIELETLVNRTLMTLVSLVSLHLVVSLFSILYSPSLTLIHLLLCWPNAH
jgi:hypothetical protein